MLCECVPVSGDPADGKFSFSLSPLSLTLFFFFLKISFYYFYWKGGYTERRDREEDLPSDDSLPK